MVQITLLVLTIGGTVYLVNGFLPAIFEGLAGTYLDQTERFSGESLSLTWLFHLQQL